jgi:HSP20 family protein
MWRDMERFQQEMNRLAEQSFGYRNGAGTNDPLMNVYTNDEAALVSVELPGYSPDDIEISVISESLTIQGERKPDDIESGKKYHRQERSSGPFNRSIELPFPVDAEKVEASMKNGILTIQLPRAEDDKPRKIAVKS